MRDYAKVAPQFWTGETGKAIRALGRDEQVIALYLLTCPSSNALGLYYLPIPTMCHETGCPIKGASKALLRVCEVGFASYDTETEHVFVHRMAEYQIGAALLPADKRISWIKKELQAYKNTPYFNVFVERYKEAFHLQELEGLGRGIDAPSKPVVRAVAVAGAVNTTLVRKAIAYSDEFTMWWNLYPRKESKGKAWEAWQRIASPRPFIEELQAALEWQVKCDQWVKDSGQFIPLPTTYLNGRKWEDKPLDVRSGGNGSRPSPELVGAFLRGELE